MERPSARASFFAVGAVCDSPRRKRYTVMSATSARRAKSFGLHPLRATSCAISAASNRIGVGSVFIANRSVAVRVSTVNNKMQRVATMETLAGLHSATVSARPVFHEELGSFFVGLSTKRGWDQSQAAKIAARRGLSALTRQVIIRLERGKTKNPEPNVLRALAELYERPYDELVGLFVEVRFGLKVNQEKAKPDQGKTLAPGQVDAAESPEPTPVEVGKRTPGRPLVHSSRRPPDIDDRPAIAEALMEYAELLNGARLAQRILRIAASALAGDEGGDTGAGRPEKDSGTGGSRGSDPGKGRS